MSTQHKHVQGGKQRTTGEPLKICTIGLGLGGESRNKKKATYQADLNLEHKILTSLRDFSLTLDCLQFWF